MSFSKAKIKRFNDTAGCGPPVGAYNPKHPTDVKKEQMDQISAETNANKCNATDENVPDIQAPAPGPVSVSLPILFTIASTTNTSGPGLTDAPPRNCATCRSTTKRRRAPRPLLISKSSSSSSDSSSSILVNSTNNGGTHTFHFSPNNKTALEVKQNSCSHFNQNQNNVSPHPVPVPVEFLGLDEKNSQEDKNNESKTENSRNIPCLNQDGGGEGGRGNNDDVTKELKLLNRDDNMLQVKFNNVTTVTEETNKGIEVRTRPFHGKRLKREKHFGVETCIKSTGTTKHTEKTKLIDQKEIEQQLILTLKANDELRKQVENVRADMDSLRTQSRAFQEGFNELQLSLETERRNLLELRTKMKKTEAELNSSQISVTSCQKQLREERYLHEMTVQELKETEAASHDQLVKENAKHILELEIQLKEKVEILSRNQAEQETVLTLISDLEMQIIAKDKEISDVTSWGNDWKLKYENNQNQTRNVIGLGAAEVITLGAFSYFKWKYG